MNPIKTTRPSKVAVLLAAGCAVIVWLVMVFVLLAALVGVVGTVFRAPIKITLHSTTATVILGLFLLNLAAGLVYLVLAVKLRCPACHHHFLKNPKAFGPVDFSYHSSCPRRPGINPWAYQIGRMLGTRRIRCINCGEELFE